MDRRALPAPRSVGVRNIVMTRVRVIDIGIIEESMTYLQAEQATNALISC